jgi:hypothetical protein
MVRNLVLLLVLANVLVWAWQRWIVPPDAVDALELQASRPPELILLNPATGSARDGAAATCLRVGPFATAADAEQGAAKIAAKGLPTELEAESVEIWVGHWVQVPALASRSAANGAREDLAAAGLADAYVVRTDSGFKISLGVFRDRDRADRVARIARGAGFDAITLDRTKDGEEYWLLVGPMAGAVLDLAGLEPAGDRILRSEAIACPAAAMDSEAGADSLESAAAAAPTPE